jgi:XTP/dITP diphosphohydrolase
MMNTLLVATQNRHKAAEIAELLPSALGAQVLTLADIEPGLDIPETGTTFRENARQKAVAAARRTGLLTLADDSGLAVDALHGEPGVHSKRFASSDEDRVRKLLALLVTAPETGRTAHFHCAVVIAGADGVLQEIEERLEGSITRTPRGANGFGYDPIFQPKGETRTLAEMSMKEKNAISHRGKAFRRAVTFLEGILR